MDRKMDRYAISHYQESGRCCNPDGKKLFPLLLGALILLGSARISAQESTTGNLKGRVKSMTVSTYAAVENSGEVQRGILKSKTDYTYDVQGKVKEQVWYGPTGIFLKKLLITYKMADGKIMEKSIHDEDGSVSVRVTLTYDDLGNETESISVNGDGSLLQRTASKYDGSGRRTEIQHDGPDGRLSSKSAIGYDDKGRKTAEYTYDPDGGMNGKSLFSYDEEGAKTEEGYYDPDDGGPAGSFSGRSVFRYDKDGNKTAHETFEGAIIKSKYAYRYVEYDRNGNWLRMIVYVNDKPDEVVERVIAYY